MRKKLKKLLKLSSGLLSAPVMVACMYIGAYAYARAACREQCYK